MSERSLVKFVNGKREPGTAAGERPDKKTPRPYIAGEYPDGSTSTRADSDRNEFISPAKPNGIDGAVVEHPEKHRSQLEIGSRTISER